MCYARPTYGVAVKLEARLLDVADELLFRITQSAARLAGQDVQFGVQAVRALVPSERVFDLCGKRAVCPEVADPLAAGKAVAKLVHGHAALAALGADKTLPRDGGDLGSREPQLLEDSIRVCVYVDFHGAI